MVTWLVTSQACSSYILKWAKDSELSRKTNHEKFLTTLLGNYFCAEWNSAIQNRLLIVKILNLTALVCHLGSPLFFQILFPKDKTITVTWPILSDFIGLTILLGHQDWLRYQFCKDNIPNPGRVITVFLIYAN